MFEGWGAAAVAATVVGGVVSSQAAGKAAGAQTDAANAATATANDQYQQTRADQMPWRDAGVGALNQLTEGAQAGGEFNRDFTLSDFTQDPGYQFRMDQGQRALDSSAAARGGALGGAAIKGSERYGQDYASNEYQNAYNRFNTDNTTRFNRLSSLAGIGQTANSAIGAAGAQNAQTVGNNQLSVGNANAASAVATGNAVQGGLNSLGNWYMQRQYQQPAANSGGGTGWAGYWQGINGNGATSSGDVLYG